MPKTTQMNSQFEEQPLSFQIEDSFLNELCEKLTYFAALLSGGSQAVISFFEKENVHLKPSSSQRTAPLRRDRSLCTHALNQKDYLLIPSLRMDPEFSQLELSPELTGIDFYLGIPIHGQSSKPLGVLCIFDDQSRLLRPAQIQHLVELAHLAAKALECLPTPRAPEAPLEKGDLKGDSRDSSQLKKWTATAANLIHQIKNPLGAIRLYFQLFSMTVCLAPEDRREVDTDFQKMESSIDRLIRNSRGIFTGSKSLGLGAPVGVALLDVIEEARQLCTDRIRSSGTEIRVDPEIIGYFMICKPAQIAQIFVNLMNNSLDAIEGTPEKWIRIEARRDSTWIEIRLTDSGPGIPTELKDHIFEAFFSTKGSGPGTGLGLSICQRIAQKHNGSLELDRESPRATFILRLPLREIE
jgi:signal transduction histidine kinase